MLDFSPSDVVSLYQKRNQGINKIKEGHKNESTDD